MYLNVSRALTFQTCEELYHNVYRLNRVSETDDKRQLNFGTWIHAGLAEWYRTRNEADALRAYRAIADESSDEYAYGERMLVDYFAHYAEDVWKLSGAKFIEEELTCQVGTLSDGEPLILVGRPDLIATNTLTNKRTHVQHKTVGATVGLDNYVRKYDLAWHERAYALLLQEAGDPIEGITLNLLRKTKVPSFARFWIPLDPLLIERFRQEFLAVAERIRSGSRIQNTNSCVLYNRTCAFQGSCMGLDLGDWGTREEDYVDRHNKGS